MRPSQGRGNGHNPAAAKKIDSPLRNVVAKANAAVRKGTGLPTRARNVDKTVDGRGDSGESVRRAAQSLASSSKKSKPKRSGNDFRWKDINSISNAKAEMPDIKRNLGSAASSLVGAGKATGNFLKNEAVDVYEGKKSLDNLNDRFKLMLMQPDSTLQFGEGDKFVDIDQGPWAGSASDFGNVGMGALAATTFTGLGGGAKALAGKGLTRASANTLASAPVRRQVAALPAKNVDEMVPQVAKVFHTTERAPMSVYGHEPYQNPIEDYMWNYAPEARIYRG